MVKERRISRMNEVRCGKCPIIDYCDAFRKLEEERGFPISPHPEDTSWVSPDNCPLMKLVRESKS